MEDDDRAYHLNKKPGKTYVSKQFTDRLTGTRMRIASKVIDNNEGLAFAKIIGETVLRVTPKQRQEIKATFVEDDRAIRTLTLQKFNAGSGPSKNDHFSFVGKEIETLLEFILNVKRIAFQDDGKVNISDEELRGIILNSTQARRVFAENEDLFLNIAQNENLKRDIVALGYRRRQLAHFERLLTDEEFFQEEVLKQGATPEGAWQAFFEANKWIFGYGLSYIFLSGLDGKKLEQVTRGYDLTGSGKRTDGLMKTRALISSLCFVEIKRHDTQLLANAPYRAGAWPPSSEISGGVAQSQATVQAALAGIGQTLRPTDTTGDPTGEVLFNIEPRSFLVAGNLSEFVSETGINGTKYRSFESYRRNVKYPEIITFDELLYRARFIVEHQELVSEQIFDHTETEFERRS